MHHAGRLGLVLLPRAVRIQLKLEAIVVQIIAHLMQSICAQRCHQKRTHLPEFCKVLRSGIEEASTQLCIAIGVFGSVEELKFVTLKCYVKNAPPPV